MRRNVLVLVAVLALLAGLRPALGEIFLLRSGGRIEGDLVNRDEEPRVSYVIRLPGGGNVTLDAAAVERVQQVTPELTEYERLRREAADTVDGHLKMSDWCRDHGLAVQRKTHLDRILQLDPDQPEVRRLLGHRKVNGKWMTLEEEKAANGYVKRDGKWMTHQEAELFDSRQKQRAAEVEWVKKISTWRAWLDGSRADQGARNLRAINDPMAIYGLSQRLVKNRDPRTDARLIYVEVLGRINAPQARAPLAMAAVDDPVEEVRLSCLDELAKQKDEAVVKYFSGRMSEKNASDAVINHAAVGLGRIKDPTCVTTLIKYLAYQREETIQTGGGPGSMTTTFNKNGGGGGGLAMNQKPRKIRYLVQNHGVLDALVAITGQNFGYDQRAWSTWYNAQVAKGAPIAPKEK